MLRLHDIATGSRWMIRLRWVASVAAVGVVWAADAWLRAVENVLPLAIVLGLLVLSNLIYGWYGRQFCNERACRNILHIQMISDLLILGLLLYFAGMIANPFLWFFVFHMILSAILMPGRFPYFLGAGVALGVALVTLLQWRGTVPFYPLHLSVGLPLPIPNAADGHYLLGILIAFACTLMITVYLTAGIMRYVDHLHTEMAQQEKLVGLGQLATGIGHQIRNPLDGIQNCLRRINRAVKDDPQLEECCTMMREALLRIEQTARRVQTFAQPSGMQLMPMDPVTAIRGMTDMLKDVLPERIALELDTTDDVPRILADAQAFQEVLFNLCSNAIAAMPAGGTLTIRTAHVAKDPLAVQVRVTDTGEGISPRTLERVFEPFFSTRQEGTGLGLAQCRVLVTHMRGQVAIDSAPGRGTQVTLRFPAAPEPSPSSTSERRHAHPRRG